MTIKLNINQIMQYLPHRYPFLLIDAVDDIIPGETIKARKNVTINEAMFNGHYPENPVVPGVIQIEAMGQTGALLALFSGAKMDEERSIYVATITDCKFRRPIIPGDVMSLSGLSTMTMTVVPPSLPVPSSGMVPPAASRYSWRAFSSTSSASCATSAIAVAASKAASAKTMRFMAKLPFGRAEIVPPDGAHAPTR